MRKSRIFNIATCWSLKKIVDHYLPKELKLMGGYIDAKYQKIKITIIVEKI